MQLVAEPFIPFALWLALAFLAIVILIWYGLTSRMAATPRRKASILVLMASTLALPLVVLLNLTWIQNVPPPAGKPVVQILIDTSASMSTQDVAGESRLKMAKTIAERAAEDLADQFDVEIATFDQTLRNSDIGSLKKLSDDAIELGPETNLATAIGTIVKADIPQGHSILLLSDGIHNTGTALEVLENAVTAQAMNVPIFVSTIGGEVGVKNIAVSLRSPQELGFIGQSVPSVFNVEATGIGRPTLAITLWKDGQQVQSRDVELGEDQRGEASFNIQESEPGLFRYEVRAEVVPEEATIADNRATLLFRVVDQPIKMLLVEGKPYWDTKFLVRRLAADPSVELTSVIRMSENRYLQRVVARAGSDPASGHGGTGTESSSIVEHARDYFSPASLAQTQIVVLGRSAENFLTDDALDALRNWIAREGGSLICARGAPSTQINQRLGQILPVRWTMGTESRFRVSMTNQGKELRWLANFGDVLGAMPSLASVATATQREGLSNVLAATIDSSAGDRIEPVISYQPYGSGRAVVVEGAGMWRWALMSPDHSEQEEVYSTLWRSLLRWLVSRAGLMPGQDVSLQPDRVSFDTGDDTTATLLLRPEKFSEVPRIYLKSEDGTESEFVASPMGQDPGVYRLKFGKLAAGQYTLEAKTVADSVPVFDTAFSVRERWVERLELDARPDLMSRLAQESGGAVLGEASPSEIANQFKAHLAESRPQQFRRVTMWDRWWIMAFVLTTWAVTWVVRRRSGLI